MCPQTSQRQLRSTLSLYGLPVVMVVEITTILVGRGLCPLPRSFREERQPFGQYRSLSFIFLASVLELETAARDCIFQVGQIPFGHDGEEIAAQSPQQDWVSRWYDSPLIHFPKQIVARKVSVR